MSTLMQTELFCRIVVNAAQVVKSVKSLNLNLTWHVLLQHRVGRTHSRVGYGVLRQGRSRGGGALVRPLHRDGPRVRPGAPRGDHHLRLEDKRPRGVRRHGGREALRSPRNVGFCVPGPGEMGNSLKFLCLGPRDPDLSSRDMDGLGRLESRIDFRPREMPHRIPLRRV